MKRIISAILAFTLMLSLFSLPAFAEEEQPEVEEAAVEVVAETETEAAEATEVEEAKAEEVGTKEGGEEAAVPVRVVFICTPEELTLTVYNEDGEEIKAEQDSSYLLLPGMYTYTAACEGYVTAEKEEISIELDDAQDVPIEINVILEPVHEVDESSEATNVQIIEEALSNEWEGIAAIENNEFYVPEGIVNTLANGRYSVSVPNGITGESIVNEAKKWANSGASYWSGTTPWEASVAWRTGFTYNGQTSFDCSGFVGRVLNDVGFRSTDYTPSYGTTVLSQTYGSGYIGISIEELVNYGADINSAVAKAKNGDYGDLRSGDLIGWTSGSLGRHIIIYAGLNNSNQPTMVEFTGNGYYYRTITASYQNAFQYGARLVPTTTGTYLDECTSYPSYLELTVKNVCVIKSLPCSGSTNPASKTLRDSVVGETFTATGIYKNTANNYWYRILVDGQVGYIYAGDVSISKKLSSISYSGKALPTNLPSGQSYAVDWTINSSYLNLKNIDGYIYSGSSLSNERYHGQITNVNATSKSLNYSSIDNALLFNMLEDGTYKLVIKASVTNNYSTDGTTLKSVELTGTPISCVFTVGSTHTHSYTNTVVAPTCTESGYTLHSCACGYSYKDNTVPAKGHSYAGTVTKQATCTESGTRTYRCSVCGNTYTETIAALGHSYTSQTIAGSCTQRPGTKYTCSRCGDTYTEYADGNWSEWTTEYPEGIDPDAIQEKTQYRYKTKETTTGSSSTMTGWILYDTKTGWSDYGAWSGWSTNYVVSNESTQVETRTGYHYYFYLCSNCGAHMHGSGTCYTWAGGCGKNTISSSSYSSARYDTPYSSSKDWYGTGVNYIDSSDGKVFAYTSSSSQHYVAPATEYRYRTRTQTTVYYFYRWTDWSVWLDSPITGSDSKQVETRKMYRYDLYSTGQHIWNSGAITKAADCETSGIKTYTCTACGEIRTETIPATGHKWGAWVVTTPPTMTADGIETRTCQNSGCGKTETRAVAAVIYTISYNANGGSGAPASQQKLKGTALTLSSGKPTRSGYSFTGWATSATATAAQYQPGASFTTDADTTLYAVWKANSYTVTFNANGGTTPTASKTVTYNSTYGTLPTPTRTGYSFAGWFTAASGGTQISASTKVSITANQTLYAHWTAKTYTVSYNANGGTGAPASQTKTHGTALTLSGTKPTRSGYSFLGWATSATATAAQYQPGGSFAIDANTTLYAVWKQDTPVITNQGILSVSSAYGTLGNEITLAVSVEKNPGIAALNFKIDYDKTRLSLIGYEDSGLTDWSVGIGAGEKAVWVDERGSTVNGEILVLTFKVLDDAAEGLAQVTLSGVLAADVDGQKVELSVTAGGITVSSRVPGDCNGDGSTDIFDLLMLKKHLAGIRVNINLQNADVNGDGNADIFDLLILKKYLAGINVELK